MIYWEDVEKTTQRVCAVVAALTNAVLLHLIVHKSPSKFGAYKYLMIYISVFEVVYAVVDVLVLPQLFTTGSGYTVVINSHKTILPLSILPLFDLLYCATFGMSMAIFAIHFVFRYLVVSGKPSWTTKKSSKILVWIAIPVIAGGVWAGMCELFLGPSDELDQFLRSNLLENTELTLEEIAYYGFYFWPLDGRGAQFLNTWHLFGTVCITLIMLTSSIIIVYFGSQCYLKIRDTAAKASRSSRFRGVQSQLFFALVLQTIIPLTLMHIPWSLIFLCCLCDVSFEALGRALTVSIALYPALDPLPNMFIIVDYRKALIAYCSMCRKSNGRMSKRCSSIRTRSTNLV